MERMRFVRLLGSGIGIDLNYRSTGAINVEFHSHPHYEIYYFHEGFCNYLIGDKIYELQPGDLIIMDGMTLHRAKTDPKRPYVRSIIHFDPSYIQEWFQLPCTAQVLKPFQQLKNARFTLAPQQQIEMAELLRRMDKFRHNEAVMADARFHIAFYDLMLFIHQVFELQMVDGPQMEGSEKIKNVQKIITYLEDQYMNDIHLEDLESALHLDKHYMSKIFKEVTGVTIFTYLYERRINESRILLYLEERMKITDISYQVGFKHPAHFSRVFKNHVGCTPEQFRKQMQLQAQRPSRKVN
ncbi:helix-turn-helix transcriptional regulator [Marinicrinis lubricantis]|uniref:AraC family transcriptional regulator n=1 Tax=Marinicrinis lubricantis TaxID=2086470 RepID=A0ABW1ITY2_9BACL